MFMRAGFAVEYVLSAIRSKTMYLSIRETYIVLGKRKINAEKEVHTKSASSVMTSSSFLNDL